MFTSIKMRIVFIIVLFLCGSLLSFAQKKNEVSLIAGGYYIPNTYNYDKTPLDGPIGLKYSLKVLSNYSASLSYSVTAKNINSSDKGLPFLQEAALWDTSFIGEIVYRSKYRYFDASLKRDFKLNGILNFLKGELGFSYAKGINTYMETLYLVPGTNHITSSTGYDVSESYYGYLLSIGFGCYFWKDRVVLASDVFYRHYLDDFGGLFNYGVRLGYRF